MKQFRIIIGIVILFLLVVACAPLLRRNNIVVIGIVISPDEYGVNVLKGAQLAVKEAGLEKVRFVVEKYPCDVQKAGTIAEKLIILHKAQVILEGVCPDLAMVLTPLAAEHQVVLLSAVSSGAESSSPFFFRIIPSHTAEAAFAADLLSRQGYAKAAILHLNNEDGRQFRNIFEKEFLDRGGKIVAAESFEKGSAQFENQLEAIADSEATALYILSDSPHSAKSFLRQRQERGISMRIYGSNWFKTDEILKLGSVAEGLTIISPRLGNVGFITKYKGLYGEEPGIFAAQAYDAYKAIALTVQQGARSSEEIRKALLNIEFQGSSGLINFDDKGEVGENFEVYVVNEGKFEPQ